MKTQIFGIDGKKAREIEMPKFFLGKIRKDIVEKVLESKKIKQPYAPNQLAGNLYSSAGKASHRRHVWKTDRGKGISRVPRKVFSRRGDQFNWEAAGIPSARGGRRAHPPKIIQMLNRARINKKEMKLALISALSATADGKIIAEKYSTLRNEKEISAPFIAESKIAGLKTKEFIESIKKILGEKLFEVALKSKSVRSGIGKLRGRKHKTTAGALLVTGKNENAKSNLIDTAKSGNLGVNDIAKGGMGRIVIYTEEAIKELEEKLK